MTEAINPTYENIRDGASGPGVEEWRRADKARADLTEFYRQLQDDPRYTPEHKSEKAWERYEAVRTQVEADSTKARELLTRSAQSAKRFAIPMPEGEGITTKDTEKLLLTQGEQSRIYRRLERLERAAGGSLKRRPNQVLQEEYTRGLEIGGPQGGAICRAVYEIARDTGADIEAIVDSHRKDSHRNALEDAQEAEMRLGLISRSVSEPPFPRPERMARGGKDVGTYRSKAAAFVPNNRAALTKKLSGNRRPHWK